MREPAPIVRGAGPRATGHAHAARCATLGGRELAARNGRQNGGHHMPENPRPYATTPSRSRDAPPGRRKRHWSRIGCAGSAITSPLSLPRPPGGGRGRVDRCQIRAPPAVVSTADAIERSAPRVWEDYPDNISFVYLKGDKAATDPRLRQSRAFGERFEVPSALGTSKRMNYGSPYPNHRTLPPRQLFTIHLRPAMSALKSLGFCSSQGPAGR